MFESSEVEYDDKNIMWIFLTKNSKDAGMNSFWSPFGVLI